VGITLDEFFWDPRTIRAVAFEFTTIGEATRVIPKEIQERIRIPLGEVFKAYGMYWCMNIFDWMKKFSGRQFKKIYPH
jgi:hypothetical protein